MLRLAPRNIEKDWNVPQRSSMLVANQFAIMFGERFPNAITSLRNLALRTEFLTGSLENSLRAGAGCQLVPLPTLPDARRRWKGLENLLPRWRDGWTSHCVSHRFVAAQTKFAYFA